MVVTVSQTFGGAGPPKGINPEKCQLKKSPAIESYLHLLEDVHYIWWPLDALFYKRVTDGGGCKASVSRLKTKQIPDWSSRLGVGQQADNLLSEKNHLLRILKACLG